jgi:hypothetical protein
VIGALVQPHVLLVNENDKPDSRAAPDPGRFGLGRGDRQRVDRQQVAVLPLDKVAGGRVDNVASGRTGQRRHADRAARDDTPPSGAPRFPVYSILTRCSTDFGWSVDNSTALLSRLSIGVVVCAYFLPANKPLALAPTRM